MSLEEADHQRVNEARAELRRKLNLAEESVRSREEIRPVRERKAPDRPIREGDTVELLSTGRPAEVTAVKPNGSLTLRAGILKMTVSQDEVVLVDKPVKKESVSASAGRALRTTAVSRELDIRGMMADEAELMVERYLDAASAARLQTVTIIHGKGTGALRSAVQQILKRSRQVKSFRLGRYGEGETGVTVVELR